MCCVHQCSILWPGSDPVYDALVDGPQGPGMLGGWVDSNGWRFYLVGGLPLGVLPTGTVDPPGGR